jgi:hypothetical protein
MTADIVEMLRDQRRDAVAVANRAEAEIERLRAALREIAEPFSTGLAPADAYDDRGWRMFWAGQAIRCRDTAIAALRSADRPSARPAPQPVENAAPAPGGPAPAHKSTHKQEEDSP